MAACAGALEITDLLWAADPVTGARLPVRRDETVARLERAGQRRAARIVARLPGTAEHIDAAATDALLVRVHCELQRLGEETQLGRRVAGWLAEPLAALRADHPGERMRVLDVGCGIGYLIRWLAARGALGADVDLVGVDLNAGLVAHARRLAAAEALDADFVVGDALAAGGTLDDPRPTVVVSTGVLHHLDAADLPAFFAAHGRARVAAFAHWDVDPGAWSSVGAWIFHQARMREPVSRHDGVLSARRAHRGHVLLAAAGAAGPSYRVSCVDAPAWRPRFSDILRPVAGRRDLP